MLVDVPRYIPVVPQVDADGVGFKRVHVPVGVTLTTEEVVETLDVEVETSVEVVKLWDDVEDISDNVVEDGSKEVVSADVVVSVDVVDAAWLFVIVTVSDDVVEYGDSVLLDVVLKQLASVVAGQAFTAILVAFNETILHPALSAVPITK